MALTDRTEGKTQASQTSTAGENERYATPRVAQSKTTCPGSAGLLLEARIAGAAPGADARNFQSCTRSLSQQPFTSPGRVLTGLPRGWSLSIHTWSLPLSPLADRCQLPPHHLDGDSRENPLPSDPNGLPREAGGRQKRLRGAYVGFPNSGPPSSTCSHRQARWSPRRAQGWSQRRPWSSQTLNESGHWKAGGLGLLILCSSASDRG